jgi:transcriptional regulator with XRE-family HTH domain
MQALSLTLSKPLGVHALVMSKKPDKAFGDRFSRLIDESKLAAMNGDQLSRRFKVSAPMISNYRHGIKIPSMPTAIRIARELDVCVEYLLTGRGPKHPGASNDDDGNSIVFDMTGIPSEQHGKFAAALHAFAQSVREVMAPYGNGKK